MTARLRAHRADAGLSLVDLLVTMVLMGVLGSILVSWFVASSRSTNGFSSRVVDLADAEVALSKFSKDVRMAIRPAADVPAFAAASSGTVASFYVNVASGAPLLVTYRTEAAGAGQWRLVREVTTPSGTGPYTWPAANLRRTYVLPAMSSASSVQFRYFRSGDSDLPPCAAPGDPGCAEPIVASPSLTELDTVGSVELVVRSNSKPNMTAATELRVRVRVANSGLTFEQP